MGPAGRGAPAAACCSPHLPGSPVLQRGKPVPSGAERRSGTRRRKERRSQARVGARSAAPRGAQGSGTVGAGTAICVLEGRGGRVQGWEAGGRLPGVRGSHWLLARCHRSVSPRSIYALPPPCLCAPPRVVPTLPLWFPLEAQSPLPRVPPPLPPSLTLPLRVQPAAWILPVLSSLRHLALQCNSGTHNQPGPLKPTASFKTRPSSLVRKPAPEAWLPGG